MTAQPSSTPLSETFRVRRATLADAAEIARLSGQLNYPTSEADVAQRLEQIQPDPLEAVYVAEAERAPRAGALAGWVHVQERHLVQHQPVAEIAALVVDEVFRGRSAGRRLMEQAEQWARDRGLAIVMLRSNVIRTGAHAFYERIGYQLLKTQKTFRKDL